MTTIKIAHLNSEGNVINVSLWDGVTEVTYKNATAIVPEGLDVSPGWLYVDEEFIDTRPQPEQPDLPEEQE